MKNTIESMHDEFVRELARRGVLCGPRIVSAFEAVDRADFVPEDMKPLAYEDNPLPIGCGQTISQPSTVAFMLGLLDVHDGDIVFDVGYGSGWQTLLLAHMVGEKGKVYAMELISDLCRLGEQHASKYPDLFSRVHFSCGDAAVHVPLQPGERIDRIIVAAEIHHIPDLWREKLQPNGILVYPSQGSVWKEERLEDGTFRTTEYPGYVFVPFVSDALWAR